MFLTTPDQKAPGLMLWNQQHQSYLHYVLIPSEPEPFCLDKLIPEALPRLEAPPVVWLVHLYKLLCGVTFDRSSSSNVSPHREFLRQETVKTGTEQCEWSFMADQPSEFGVRPTSAAALGQVQGCTWICNATDRHFLVIAAKCIMQTSHCS